MEIYWSATQLILKFLLIIKARIIAILYNTLCYTHDWRELVRAVQNRNISLEDECKKFATRVADLKSQLEAKDKVS